MTLFFLLLAPVFAGESEKQGTAVVMREAKPREASREEALQEDLEGLVGTVVAVDSGAHTIVVDVPLAKGVLRVGAWATADTTFSGVESLGDVKPGSRVRIDLRRVERGDELTGLDVLRSPK